MVDIDITKEAKAIGNAIQSMLAKARAAGVRKPGIYFESEGCVHVIDLSNPAWDGQSTRGRHSASVASHPLSAPYDVGSW